MNIDIEELERKASEVSGWSGCTVLELIGEVRRLQGELSAAEARASDFLRSVYEQASEASRLRAELEAALVEQGEKQ